MRDPFHDAAETPQSASVPHVLLCIRDAFVNHWLQTLVNLGFAWDQAGVTPRDSLSQEETREFIPAFSSSLFRHMPRRSDNLSLV